MKIITSTDTKVAKWKFEDDKVLVVGEKTITVGDPPEFIIGDMGSSNSTIHENITDIPDDWTECKYKYDGTEWTECEKFKAAAAEYEAQQSAASEDPEPVGVTTTTYTDEDIIVP